MTADSVHPTSVSEHFSGRGCGRRGHRAPAQRDRNTSALFALVGLLLSAAGCVTSRPASFLVPELSSPAQLQRAATIVRCAAPTNGRELWWSGASTAACLVPVAEHGPNQAVLDSLPAGTRLVPKRARYVNGIDAAWCLLFVEAEQQTLVIAARHVETLLGAAPRPKSKRWYCMGLGPVIQSAPLPAAPDPADRDGPPQKTSAAPSAKGA